MSEPECLLFESLDLRHDRGPAIGAQNRIAGSGFWAHAKDLGPSDIIRGKPNHRSRPTNYDARRVLKLK